jgi:hypothetical protein
LDLVPSRVRTGKRRLLWHQHRGRGSGYVIAWSSAIISDWLPSQSCPAISPKVSRVPSTALTALVHGSVPLTGEGEPDVVEAPADDPPGDLVAVQLVQPGRDQAVLVGTAPVHPRQPDGVPGGIDDPRATDGQRSMQ